MTKRKYLLPFKQVITGDISEPVSSTIEQPVRNTLDAQRHLLNLRRKGFGISAVVAPKNYGLETWCNPNHWGVIVDVHPFSPKPLCVSWVSNGTKTMNMDEDLIIVYACRDKDSLKSEFQSRQPIL